MTILILTFMTNINFDNYVTCKVSPRKFEVAYPKETKEIIDLLKHAHNVRKADPRALEYNYKAIARYCIDVKNYKMVSLESLRKIVVRIAKDNSCEL